jgi:RNA-directed DNA polymerase
VRENRIISSAISSLRFDRVVDWSNLLLAWRKAARGKRGKAAAADFEYRLADRLLELQQVLENGSYRPGGYTHFTIHEPKRRLISAAPFRDRVVHHALCNVIEPHFERRFIPDSYANRVGKGTHKAIDRLQQFARHYPYVLRLDIVKHFPALDHQLLLVNLARVIEDGRIMALVKAIIASGEGVLEQEYRPRLFPGDDLLALCRPRGLPIGNLTSQFWSNCYLHPLDLFVKRELGCRGYLRYVDDICLFAHGKQQLWGWKRAVEQRLAALRLEIHEHSAQVMPTRCGIPWLGFVVYPDHRRVKSRKVVEASRRLSGRFDAWQSGRISFGEFDASVQGWINHVRHADSWGLRRHLLERFWW